jgi:putative ABC transport system substrate-binding protein
VRRVGALMGYVEADPEGQVRFQVFRQRLADLGWAEGRNLHVDVRWAVDVAQQQSHARELVALVPESILTTNTTTTQAAREATRTIPIVFVTLGDAVTNGVVSNLARPEANVRAKPSAPTPSSLNLMGLDAPPSGPAVFEEKPTMAAMINPFDAGG